jgi:hypothetical protein
VKKLITSVFPVLALLLMAGGCERALNKAENTGPQKEYQETEAPACSVMPQNNESILPASASHQKLTERFASMTEASSKEADIPEYYDPGYSIPSSETSIILDFGSEKTEDRQQTNIARQSDITLTTEYQKYFLEEDIYFMIAFDNDIFSNTDYYYTNGLAFELYHPYLSNLPSRLMLPSAGNSSANAYFIKLYQTLFTPVDPDKTLIQYGDRPFASFLVLGFGNISNNPVKNLRITSELDLGVIGPAALGGTVQRTIHDIEPVGWQNQISNDLVIHYAFQVEKGIPLGPTTMLTGLAGGEIGTLRSNLTAGAGLRFSNGLGYFESAFLKPSSASSKNKLSYSIHLTADATLVGYDATLQGGMTNPENSVYRISAQDIDRIVFHCKAGAGLNFRRFSLEAEHVYLTPEFSTGKAHMWTRLKTVFKL